MKNILLLFYLFTVLQFAQQDSSLSLTEIMFIPTSGNNEFIEIFNLSFTDTIDLNGYKIKYETANADIIRDTIAGTLLLPRSFAVVLEGDYDFANGIYNSLIPANALIVKISDNAFGSSGMANTSSRTIALLRPNNDTLETYLYSANNGTAISDEKIFIDKNNSQTNWGNSKFANGTPGKRNSITPNQIDLSVSNFSASIQNVILGESFSLNSVVKNLGTNLVTSAELKFYHDLNKDSIAQTGEEIFFTSLPNIASNDSIASQFIYSNHLAGENIFIANIFVAGDEDSTNNKLLTKMFGVVINEFRNDIVINEIMYAPTSPEPEWIEIYNRSTKTINLKNYRIADAADTVVLTTQSITITPQEFIVVAKDSSIKNHYNITSKMIYKSFPTLNNDVDKVIIMDSLFRVIDSVQYRSGWGGGSGFSLERINVDVSTIDSTNWKTAMNQKATPGRKNSVTQKDFDVEVSRVSFIPSLPLKGEAVSISAAAKNRGKNLSSFTFKLFESTLRDSIPDLFIEESTTLNLSQGDSLIHSFNFNITSLQTEKMFIAKAIFASDEDTLNNFAIGKIAPGYPPSSIVVNEIMYSPINGEPEWIEFYNGSNDIIQLKDWKVSDVVTTPVSVTLKDYLLAPKEYFVVSKDSSIFLFHQSIPAKVIVASLPTLNNDRDGVVIRDNRNVMIDSVLYLSSWGGAAGFSLERKNISDASNNQLNWGTSNDIEYSTPGRLNSQSPKQLDLEISFINSEPQFPIIGDDVKIIATVKNRGTNASNIFAVKFYLFNEATNSDSLLEQSNHTTLSSGDSILIKTINLIRNIQTTQISKVVIEMSGDENIFNNSATKTISVGENSKSILITEIMYAPISAEPEWIELYNNSSTAMNLKDWSIGDLIPSQTKTIITSQDYILQPDSFVVISKDSSILNYYQISSEKILLSSFSSLGNSNDGVFVYDYRNAIIDSVVYNSSWGGKNGKSLERISKNKFSNDSSNWFSSLDSKRATPGKVNSLSSITTPASAKLIINEVMYDPDIDNCEYIEFYNASNDSFNIGGWKLEESGKNYFLIDSLLYINAGAYFVIAADSMILNKYENIDRSRLTILNSSSFSLSNSGEKIILRNLSGGIIDSFDYNPNMHNKNFPVTKNISLERINPNIDTNEKSNWRSSVSAYGGTPGTNNSIAVMNEKFSSGLIISPNPFSPDDDGFEDFSIINYTLPFSIAQIRVRIYDSKGRFIRSLVDAYPGGTNGSIIFDGKDESGKALRLGIYIILFEAVDQINGEQIKLKSTVVVAKKL